MAEQPRTDAADMLHASLVLLWIAAFADAGGSTRRANSTKYLLYDVGADEGFNYRRKVMHRAFILLRTLQRAEEEKQTGTRWTLVLPPVLDVHRNAQRTLPMAALLDIDSVRRAASVDLPQDHPGHRHRRSSPTGFDAGAGNHIVDLNQYARRYNRGRGAEFDTAIFFTTKRSGKGGCPRKEKAVYLERFWAFAPAMRTVRMGDYDMRWTHKLKCMSVWRRETFTAEQLKRRASAPDTGQQQLQVDSPQLVQLVRERVGSMRSILLAGFDKLRAPEAAEERFWAERQKLQFAEPIRRHAEHAVFQLRKEMAAVEWAAQRQQAAAAATASLPALKDSKGKATTRRSAVGKSAGAAAAAAAAPAAAGAGTTAAPKFTALHWRRNDFRDFHGASWATVNETAAALSQHIQRGRKAPHFVFLATDAPQSEVDQLATALAAQAAVLGSKLPPGRSAAKHSCAGGDGEHCSSAELLAYGGVYLRTYRCSDPELTELQCSLVEQLVASLAEVFIGTMHSTFSIEIYFERRARDESLGIPPRSSTMGAGGRLLPYCSRAETEQKVARAMQEKGRKSFSIFQHCEPYWFFIAGSALKPPASSNARKTRLAP